MRKKISSKKIIVKVLCVCGNNFYEDTVMKFCGNDNCRIEDGKISVRINGGKYLWAKFDCKKQVIIKHKDDTVSLCDKIVES